MQFNFNEDKDLICNVIWSDEEQFIGKFSYIKDKNLSLTVHSSGILQNKEFVKEQIFVVAFDNENRKYYITLRNCRGILETIGGGYYSYIVYFDFALISNWSFFDFKKQQIESIDLYFNTWNEFFVSQSNKEFIELKSHYDNLTLKNKALISFKSDFESYFIGENDNIFNLIFDSEKLNKKEKNIMSKEIKKIVNPYKNKLRIRNIDSHNWYINIKLIDKNKCPDDYIWLFHILIAILTYDFSTRIEKVNIKTTVDNKCITYNYIDYRHFPALIPRYKNKLDIFNYNSFTVKEWKKILDNLFKYSTKIHRLFQALTENNMNNQVEEFMLARYIACIETISGEIEKKLRAKQIKDNNGKFDRTLLQFIQDFDKETQTEVLNIFRETLKIFKNKNNKNKRNWKAIAVKISDLRAMLLHFSDNKTNKIFVNMLDYFKMYKIFELIIIDYIFQIIEIDKNKRFQYKSYYLRKLIHYTIN